MNKRKPAFKHWFFRVKLLKYIASLLVSALCFSFMFSWGSLVPLGIISIFISSEIILKALLWITLALANAAAIWPLKILFIDNFFIDRSFWKEEVIPERVIWDNQVFILKPGDSKILYTLFGNRMFPYDYLFPTDRVNASEIFLPNASDLEKLKEFEDIKSSIELYNNCRRSGMSIENFFDSHIKELHPDVQMKILFNIEKVTKDWQVSSAWKSCTNN